jgi:hypothetical protein
MGREIYPPRGVSIQLVDSKRADIGVISKLLAPSF